MAFVWICERDVRGASLASSSYAEAATMITLQQQQPGWRRAQDGSEEAIWLPS